MDGVVKWFYLGGQIGFLLHIAPSFQLNCVWSVRNYLTAFFTGDFLIMFSGHGWDYYYLWIVLAQCGASQALEFEIATIVSELVLGPFLHT